MYWKKAADIQSANFFHFDLNKIEETFRKTFKFKLKNLKVFFI